MSDEKNKEKLVIEILDNGPLIVKGLDQLTNSAGDQESHEKKVFALCRCGGSNNKPYCDGTHSRIGFNGERVIKRPLDRSRAYAGSEITIHDNRTICAHAAECVKNLPAVFNNEDSPWINPDGASVDEIIGAIKKCPSGALSYTINDEHHSENGLEPQIIVEKDGPYNISGKIDLKHKDDSQAPNPELYSLCRCGASKNKPFCDGMHHEAEFKE